MLKKGTAAKEKISLRTVTLRNLTPAELKVTLGGDDQGAGIDNNGHH